MLKGICFRIKMVNIVKESVKESYSKHAEIVDLRSKLGGNSNLFSYNNRVDSSFLDNYGEGFRLAVEKGYMTIDRVLEGNKRLEHLDDGSTTERYDERFWTWDSRLKTVNAMVNGNLGSRGLDIKEVEKAQEILVSQLQRGHLRKKLDQGKIDVNLVKDILYGLVSHQNNGNVDEEAMGFYFDQVMNESSREEQEEVFGGLVDSNTYRPEGIFGKIKSLPEIVNNLLESDSRSKRWLARGVKVAAVGIIAVPFIFGGIGTSVYADGDGNSDDTGQDSETPNVDMNLARPPDMTDPSFENLMPSDKKNEPTENNSYTPTFPKESLPNSNPFAFMDEQVPIQEVTETNLNVDEESNQEQQLTKDVSGSLEYSGLVDTLKSRGVVNPSMRIRAKAFYGLKVEAVGVEDYTGDSRQNEYIMREINKVRDYFSVDTFNNWLEYFDENYVLEETAEKRFSAREKVKDVQPGVLAQEEDTIPEEVIVAEPVSEEQDVVEGFKISDLEKKIFSEQVPDGLMSREHAELHARSAEHINLPPGVSDSDFNGIGTGDIRYIVMVDGEPRIRYKFKTDGEVTGGFDLKEREDGDFDIYYLDGIPREEEGLKPGDRLLTGHTVEGIAKKQAEEFKRREKPVESPLVSERDEEGWVNKVEYDEETGDRIEVFEERENGEVVERDIYKIGKDDEITDVDRRVSLEKRVEDDYNRARHLYKQEGRIFEAKEILDILYMDGLIKKSDGLYQRLSFNTAAANEDYKDAKRYVKRFNEDIGHLDELEAEVKHYMGLAGKHIDKARRELEAAREDDPFIKQLSSGKSDYVTDLGRSPDIPERELKEMEETIRWGMKEFRDDKREKLLDREVRRFRNAVRDGDLVEAEVRLDNISVLSNDKYVSDLEKEIVLREIRHAKNNGKKKDIPEKEEVKIKPVSIPPNSDVIIREFKPVLSVEKGEFRGSQGDFLRGETSLGSFSDYEKDELPGVFEGYFRNLKKIDDYSLNLKLAKLSRDIGVNFYDRMHPQFNDTSFRHLANALDYAKEDSVRLEGEIMNNMDELRRHKTDEDGLLHHKISKVVPVIGNMLEKDIDYVRMQAQRVGDHNSSLALGIPRATVLSALQFRTGLNSLAIDLEDEEGVKRTSYVLDRSKNEGLYVENQRFDVYGLEFENEYGENGMVVAAVKEGVPVNIVKKGSGKSMRFKVIPNPESRLDKPVTKIRRGFERTDEARKVIPLVKGISGEELRAFMADMFAQNNVHFKGHLVRNVSREGAEVGRDKLSVAAGILGGNYHLTVEDKKDSWDIFNPDGDDEKWKALWYALLKMGSGVVEGVNAVGDGHGGGVSGVSVSGGEVGGPVIGYPIGGEVGGPVIGF